MSMRRRLIGGWLLAFAALSTAHAARADEIRVIASNAVKEAVVELTPAFEKQTGHRVSVTWGGTTDIARRVESGEPFDIAIIPGPVIDALVKSGAMRPDTRRDFADSLVGAAGAPGAPWRDVSSANGLKISLLEARSIVLSSGPSSGHLMQLFRQMSIEDVVAPKITRLAPGLSVGEEGELGFTQVSELLHISGIVFLGPLGPEVQHETVFSICRPSSLPLSGSAGQLIEYLVSPASKRAVERSGPKPR